MRYIHQHIDTILSHYDGTLPLAQFLKHYFKKHPILGSRDRKLLSEMAYSYYRCAKGLSPSNLSQVEKIDASLLLAESNLPHISKLISEDLKPFYGKKFEENINTLLSRKIVFDIENLISSDLTLSNGIKKEEWLHSMLCRPRLFIYVATNHIVEVKNLLKQATITYVDMGKNCLAFANGTAIEKILPQKMYRIQDASSQRTGNCLKIEAEETVWDCCSGAGGKALLVKDVAPDAKLLVSDVRKTILDNLAERFALYNYKIPERIILSASNADQTKKLLSDRKFQHIIADVPCSGSGTWARTPEQMYFFDPKTLHNFAQRQLNIAENASQYLKENGKMIYITCSIFKAENEDIVNQLLILNPELKLLEHGIINGIQDKADNMYFAVIQKKYDTD